MLVFGNFKFEVNVVVVEEDGGVSLYKYILLSYKSIQLHQNPLQPQKYT
jgi:hypothetical protein